MTQFTSKSSSSSPNGLTNVSATCNTWLMKIKIKESKIKSSHQKISHKMGISRNQYTKNKLYEWKFWTLTLNYIERKFNAVSHKNSHKHTHIYTNLTNFVFKIFSNIKRAISEIKYKKFKKTRDKIFSTLPTFCQIVAITSLQQL